MNETGTCMRSFLPSTAVLELTYKCNHACRFCSCPWYGGMIKPGKEMSVDEWKQCITELCEAGITSFAFTGGEMLLKDGWEDIVHHAASLQAYHYEEEDGAIVCKRKRPSLFLLSNGKIMSDRVLDICKMYDANLSMSLPGITTFEQHTCGGTTPEHVLDWFIRAKEKGVRTTAGITVTSENYFELYETVAAALLAGATTILMNRFLPGGRGLSHRELDLTTEQIREFPFTVEKVLAQAGRFGSVGTEFPYCLAHDSRNLEHLSLNTTCGAAKGFFVVGPSGMLRVCNHSPRELVHWKQWNTLMEHPYWRQFIFKDYLPDACKGCTFSGQCDGGCREAAHVCHGSPTAIDPALSACTELPLPRILPN